MQSPAAAPRWTTSSHGDTAQTSPGELSALGEHLNRCNGSRGHWFLLQCIAETLDGFVAPRFVTTVVVIALLAGIASLLL